MTTRMFELRKLIITLLVCAVFAPAMFGQGHGGGCACGSHTDLATVWEIDHSTAPFQDAATAEFQRWNNYATVFNSRIGDLSAGRNGKNEIFFATVAQTQQTYGFPIDQNTFGITYFSPQSNFGTFNFCPKPAGMLCGPFSETDVIINSDFTRTFTPTGPIDFDDDNGPANYGATAVHELGHTLGLHHNFNNLSTMNYYEDYGCQYISMADTAILRAQFPNQVVNVSDLGTYPFYYDSTQTQYDGTSPVALSPLALNVGSPLTISNFTIENPGTSSMANTVLRFYLSSDATVTTEDIALGSISFNQAFGTNNFYEVGAAGKSFTVPSTVPTGTYYVGAIVFFNSTQTDGVTYNNSWVGPDQVSIMGTGGGGGSSTCTPSSANLCLLNNRFKVTLTVSDSRVAGGATSPGVANLGSKSDYGFFDVPAATFTTDSPVVFVKLIDGRPVNNKYWVFYGGLTDVQYTFVVTDTVTGAQKSYSKVTGTYDGKADTNAFPGP